MSAPRAAHSITPYERAVCYYTLPQVTHPFTYALAIAFGACLAEALGALIFGLYTENRTYTAGGAAALAGLILFGIVAFTGRAFLSEYRRRRALAQAYGMPEHPAEPTESADELIDPFAEHLLLQWRSDAPGTLYDFRGPDTAPAYSVETAPHKRQWRICGVEDGIALEARAAAGAASFQFGSSLPRVIDVARGGAPIGRIRTRLTVRSPGVCLEPADPAAPRLVVRNDGIYEGGRLRGRIYDLRQARYLDVERAHCSPLLVAYFAATL